MHTYHMSTLSDPDNMWSFVAASDSGNSVEQSLDDESAINFTKRFEVYRIHTHIRSYVAYVTHFIQVLHRFTWFDDKFNVSLVLLIQLIMVELHSFMCCNSS